MEISVGRFATAIAQELAMARRVVWLAPLVAHVGANILPRITSASMADVQAWDAVRGRDGLAQALATPPGISHHMDDVRVSIGCGIARQYIADSGLEFSGDC